MEIFLHNGESGFTVGFGIMNRLHDDTDDPSDRILIGPNIGSPGYQAALEKWNAQFYTISDNAKP
jgi:hypothetical protein